ncbi:MAG: deoxyguanosinetriphosphate triphosphohydrolase [Firmicutes bacterium]|nr:deoxyguanosinetriphosphate triphosphohydrolase [Bacillota bacterium]
MLLRQKTEELEERNLSPRATLSKHSRGRKRWEKECPVRTAFQRDRDRILHSKAFRRLKHKTQVFIAPEGDHYRTRLTHTLEVSQIARTIARSLQLNEDLTEAIALGHDLGHTPFGHSGEAALDEVSAHGFRHNVHSLRVVDVLEGEGGLNLTWEVRDGILNHTGPEPSTLEGQIVRIADWVAYINHDIDDALRADVIAPEELPQDCLEILGREHSVRINEMVIDLIATSWGRNRIQMSPRVEHATKKLRTYLFEHVYTNPRAKGEENKAKSLLKQLYYFYLEHPEEMDTNIKGNDLGQAVIDYIAGMTDRYALKQFNLYFVPSQFKDYV